MKKNIFILSHSSGIDGPVDYFERYLIKNKYLVTKLEHPLDNCTKRKSTIFINGEKKLSMERKSIGIGALFVDFAISIKKTFKDNINIFIGANNFDTLVGIILRAVFRKKISKIIYFASDFSEERYKSKILNYIYYKIEKIVLKKSDLIVSNTKRAERKRISIGLDYAKSKVVPNGVQLKDLSFKNKNINKKNFIFIGSVTGEHGLYDIIKVIYPIIDKLVIIGRGDEWNKTINLCKNKNINIETYVNKNNEFVIEYLKNFDGLGLAPYNLKSKWTYYCSPLKINEYISCGVPVITSNIPEIASFVEEKKLGIVYDKIDYNVIVNRIEKFDSGNFNEKAKFFYKKYSYDYLFNKIIK